MPYPNAQDWRDNAERMNDLYAQFKLYREAQKQEDPDRIQELTVVIDHMFWALSWLIWQNDGLEQQ